MKKWRYEKIRSSFEHFVKWSAADENAVAIKSTPDICYFFTQVVLVHCQQKIWLFLSAATYR